MYPRPVKAGVNSLLLIKASLDFLTENTDEQEAQRKVLFSLLAISAVVVVCVENSEACLVIEQIQDLRRRIRERMGAKEAKLVVVAGDQLEKSSIGRKFSKLQQEDPEMLLCRTDDSQLQYMLAYPLLSAHFAPFLARLQTATRTPVSIQGLTQLLSHFFRLLNFPLSFTQYTIKSALWTLPNFSELLDELEVKVNSAARLESASAQPLFVRYFDSVAINEIFLQQIGREFEFSASTVVLTVLGSPGLGKSTLLNCIARAACEKEDLEDIFPIGGRFDPMTTSCTALSHPISLHKHQLMLVDMGGLGGCETQDPVIDAIQGLTLSAVLAMASVPCILFTHDVHSLQFVEKVVEKICHWNQLLGFSTERILMLFHDKLPSSDPQNVQVLQLIERLNSQYFGGAEVLQVRNKPNLAASGNKSLCEDFIYGLLGSVQYPKRNYSGSGVNLGNLLDSIRYIVKYYKQQGEVQVDAQHKAQTEFFLASRKTELEAIYHRIRSTDEYSHLETLFNEMFRQNIGFFDCENAIDLVKDQVNREIVHTANQYRLRLSQIENCHRFTAHMTKEELTKLLEQMLDYLYRESWVITSFVERADEVKGKLVEMVERYSDDGEKMAGVLVAFAQKQENLRNWFIANYTMQAATTLVTGGFGAAANGTRAVLLATRLGYAAAVGGTMFVVRTAYGITTTLTYFQSAFRLFTFSKTYPSGLLAKAKWMFTGPRDVVALSEAYVNRIQGLEAGVPLAVMLVIGSKKSGAHTILNQLVQCVSPFSCSTAQAFSDSKSSQCLFFSYCQHTLTQTSRPPGHGLAIYLRVTEKTETKKFRMLVKIAASLLPCVSTVALYLNAESQMVKAVFDSLQSTAAVQMRSLQLPKVAAYVAGSGRVKLLHELKQRLDRSGCLYRLNSLPELTPAEVQSTVVSLKRDLDQSPLLCKEDFEQHLRTTVGQTNAID